jgi:hypothetical protein
VDSTIASQLVENLRGLQEQLTEVLFRRASAFITGATGPHLSLADLNPVVGAQIRAVVEGQFALLYTARATAMLLADKGSMRAHIIMDSLSEAEFAATVFQAVQEEGTASPSPLDVALGIPGTRDRGAPCRGNLRARLALTGSAGKERANRHPFMGGG